MMKTDTPGVTQDHVDCDGTTPPAYWVGEDHMQNDLQEAAFHLLLATNDDDLRLDKPSAHSRVALARRLFLHRDTLLREKAGQDAIARVIEAKVAKTASVSGKRKPPRKPVSKAKTRKK